MNCSTILGKLIKEKRIEEGYSIRELAKLVGISDTELGRIENGERAVPNLLALIYICKNLGLDMENILELSGFMDNPIDKPYEVAVYKTSKTDLKKLTIFGTNEEDVIDKLNKYMDDNYIYDLSKEEEIFYEITKTPENFILDDEENKDEINENFCENNDCMSCKYYCPICGECTYGDD